MLLLERLRLHGRLRAVALRRIFLGLRHGEGGLFGIQLLERTVDSARFRFCRWCFLVVVVFLLLF